MPDAYWAAQPATVVGSVDGASGNVTLNTHLSEFSIDDSVEAFFGQFNNEKFDRDGGIVSYTKSVSATSFDLTKGVVNGGLAEGDRWSTCVATYESEGPSANVAGYGTLTATIDAMRCESSSKADNGGRMAVTATLRATSSDGTTNPIVWAVE